MNISCIFRVYELWTITAKNQNISGKKKKRMERKKMRCVHVSE